MLQLEHKKLEVYKISLLLIKELYELTLTFPADERFTLVSQLRRAALSVCSNIAEGSSRNSKPDRKRFYEIARGSIVEISTQIEVAVIMQYIQQTQLMIIDSHLESIFRMLSKMINNLRV